MLGCALILFPHLLFLFSRILRLSLLGSWLHLTLLMLIWKSLDAFFSVSLDTQLLLLISFGILWVTFFFGRLGLNSPEFRDASCLDGLGLRFKLFFFPSFSRLATLVEVVETTGVWLEGLLGAYIAMLTATPPKRPLSVLLVVDVVDLSSEAKVSLQSW